ncbi:MAG TPA: 4Fe-4S dicluster domain-containing protein [Candidatus Limnocylindrales bacterium]|nr:4Fe-4S dicluster domain-containing protein [Candidatus Limnocylindrales bacterium]
MTVALENVPGAATTAQRPRRTSDPTSWSPLAIASDRCKGCELCIGACPHAVLALDTGVVNKLGYHPIRLVDAAGCTSCALCAKVCPDAVFTVFAPRKEA